MNNRYEGDVVAWATEQASLLRQRAFELLDTDNLAEEIDSVARAERRELGSRLFVLLAHLLKWQMQAERRCNSWLRTIRHQRSRIARALNQMPSLRPLLNDPEWLGDVWEDAVALAHADTGIDAFPDQCPWTPEEALNPAFLPA